VTNGASEFGGGGRRGGYGDGAVAYVAEVELTAAGVGGGLRRH
jgi:hypothetical protein